jgi:hypothetical protein
MFPGYASWMLAILPQMEQSDVYNAHNFSRAAWELDNATTVARRIEAYLCPSDRLADDLYRFTWVGGPAEMAYTSYAGNLGTNYLIDYYDYGPTTQPDGVLFRASHVQVRDITDGTAQTLLAGERVHPEELLRPVWAFGMTGKVVADSGTPMVGPSDEPGIFGFGSHHAHGGHFLMADGSVGLVSHSVSLDLFRALGTRGGREEGTQRPF